MITMSVLHAPDSQPTLTNVFDCLTESRRRETIEALCSADGALSERELAAALAGDDGIAAGDPETVQAALRHVHLPELEELDLVDWSSVDGTVSLGNHPILDNEQFRSLLASEDDRWDRATTVHADERRRAVVEALSAGGTPTTRTELAEQLAAAADVDDGARADRLAVQLHHIHLPKLASVGLLTYDAAEGTVVPDDDMDVPWFEAPTAAN